MAGASLAAISRAGQLDAVANVNAPQQQRRFKLHYAPHFGMFREHAGGDPVAELQFMAAEGFTALEDNNMRTRPVAEQERIGSTLAKLGMRMGVFVAHTINWTSPTLTSPNAQHRDAFLKEVTESVEIAKRVGATWMTVVPGYVDSRPHFDFQTARVIDTLKRAAAILEPSLRQLSRSSSPGR